MNKVLICSNVYPPNFVGGAELIAHSQALCLQRRGWDVAVFAGDAHVAGARHSMSLQEFQGLPVYRVKLTPEDYQPEYTNFFHEAVERHFATLLDEFRPDLIHAHNLMGLSLGILHAAKVRGIRTVVTLHDHWGFCYKNTLIKRDHEVCRDYSRCAECMAYVSNGGSGFPIEVRQGYMALQFENVDEFISPSQYLADRYVSAGFAAAKMSVVWNGVDLARFAAVRKTSAPGRVRFTFIGHLGAHKGLGTVLDALPLIRARHKVALNFVGGGELQEELRRRVDEMGLQASVKFWGKIDNSGIEEVFRHTDVQILPSIWPENQPVSITEAMATRTPVIASRIGGIPELVEDGRSGYLFKAGNAADMAEKMSLFIDHPERIREFGEEGLRRIDGKSVENQVAEICGIYSRKGAAQQVAADRVHLIVCAGNNFSADCTRAVGDLRGSGAGRAKYQFVMADWLADDQFREAHILWVVGSECAPETVRRALRYGIPLLVPEGNRELREHCRLNGCGLYYRDAAEARESIAYLFENRPVLKQLSANAQGGLGCSP